MAKRHLWWILSGVCLLLCIGFIIVAYRFDWSGIGFSNKTVWDWLQLLIVPLALAVGALLFQLANARTERQFVKQLYEQDRDFAHEKQQGDLLQMYIDRMSDLLLKEKLLTSSSEEVRNVARVRTTTVLCQLDGKRVGYVFSFLRAAGLMSTQSNENVVSLRQADLRTAKWSKANLIEANITGVILSNADLREAILSDANLTDAVLYGADLTGADLSKANLSGVTFTGAKLKYANLSEANLHCANLQSADLSGANLHYANLSNASLPANFDSAHLSKEQLAQVKHY